MAHLEGRLTTRLNAPLRIATPDDTSDTGEIPPVT
jgi:hypothetical protein